MRYTTWFGSLVLVWGVLLILGLGRDVAAQDEPEEAPTIEQGLAEIVDKARTSSEIDHRYNLETLACGEFEHLAHSDREHDHAVVGMLMVWAHGYRSGLEGLDFQARPISMEGLVELTRHAIAECEQHPEMLFHVAVGRIDG